MKNFTVSSTLLLASGLVMSLSASAAPKKPNVILIMVDDMGWKDVGFNGGEVIKTPHLDQMAKDGVILDRFYSASAVSSPTRASVLTGRNPTRTGIFTANYGILRTEEITIPELLKTQGYVSAHFGKWHLGTMTTTVKDGNRGGKAANINEYNPPKLHGYDVAFATESKVPTWDPMLKPENNKIGTAMDADKSLRQSYGTAYWDIDGNKVEGNMLGDDSRVIMDRVLPFIEQSKKDKNPFLAVVWFHTPHAPCVAGPEYAAMYADKPVKFQNYAGCITAMDEQVGRLRAYLKEQKLDENTMIWFCSDNGPEPSSPGDTGEFFEGKRSVHEGGVRVPACMVWPSKVKPGGKIMAPLWTCDYLPTVAAAAGVDPKLMKYELDGKDVMPIVLGKEKKRNAPFVIAYGLGTSYQHDDYKVYTFAEYAAYYNIITDRGEKNPDKSNAIISDVQQDIDKIISSYKNSFEGGEYGTVSYDKLGDKWAGFRSVKIPANFYPEGVAKPAAKKKGGNANKNKNAK
ncbi:MAG: sulfatase-like hydrolase/transferase [Rikenellaceae bacterium]